VVRSWAGALSERDFRLFFTGYLTSYFGSQMVPVAVTFAVLNNGGTAADVGYVLAAETVPLVVFLPIGYAIVGPLAGLLSITGTLWLAVAWSVLTTAGVLVVPSVWRLRAPAPSAPEPPAPAPAPEPT
jgi:hypothetical protein